MLRTFSKIYALAGLRLGWAYAPREVVDVLDRVRPPFNVSAPAIAAGIAALADQEHVARARRHNAETLPWFATEMEKLGFIVNPSVANFVIVRFPADSPHDIGAAYRALMNAGIVTRRVGGYGLPDWLRISIGTREEMQAVLDVLAQFAGQS